MNRIELKKDSLIENIQLYLSDTNNYVIKWDNFINCNVDIFILCLNDYLEVETLNSYISQIKNIDFSNLENDKLIQEKIIEAYDILRKLYGEE